MHKPLVNHVLFRPKASRRIRGRFLSGQPLALRARWKFSPGKGFVMSLSFERGRRKGKLVGGQTPVIGKGKQGENVGKGRRKKKKRGKENE